MYFLVTYVFSIMTIYSHFMFMSDYTD